jgi:RNA polymerase sigma-70 factor (ECF subfamily)
LKRKEENEDIIKSIRDGDSHSLNLLFHSVYPHLCAYANSFLHDRDEAEEVAQEVFCKLWINRALLDETLSLKAYLFTAVKNNSLKVLEHQKVKDKYKQVLTYVHHTLPHNSADEIFAGDELEREFNKALATLPAQSRKIFELSRNEGFTYQEIAAQLKISPKTVETQMSRALQKLRLQLKDYILLAIFFHH